MLNILQTVADTAQALPSTGPDLLMYLSTLLAGALSGVAVKYLGLASAAVANMNELLRLAIIAVLSFAMLKLATFMGITLPSNPLNADPATVQAAIASILGWLTHKGLAAAGVATNAASTKG